MASIVEIQGFKNNQCNQDYYINPDNVSIIKVKSPSVYEVHLLGGQSFTCDQTNATKLLAVFSPAKP